MVPVSSLILLATAMVAATAEAKSECWKSVYNETFACFSSAPIAYSFDIDTAVDCKQWCGETAKCEAWVYTNGSNRCDLHRAAPLSTLPNSGFIYGGCPLTTANETQPTVAGPSSLHVPSPSRSATASSSHVAMNPSGSVRLDRS
jgi:hypothetical protein